MAGLGAEIMFPGHGPPVIGAARVKRAFTEQAEYLESICEQTLALINAGKTLNEIIHSVKVPNEYHARPYLKPFYDDPRWIAQTLWRRYASWWDHDPAHLFAARKRDLTKAVCELCDDAENLA